MDDPRHRFLMDSIRETARTDFLRAGEICEEAVHSFPRSADLHAISVAYRALRGRVDDARSSVAIALQLGQESALPLAAKGWFSAFEGRCQEAIIYADKAIDLDGTDRDVLCYAGNAYSLCGECDKAVKTASREAEIYADDDAASRLISALSIAMLQDQAESALREAERRFPDSIVLRRMRAKMHENAHEFTASVKLLREVSDACPGLLGIWSDLGTGLHGAGFDTQAEEALRRALEISPCDSSALCTLGNISVRRGHWREARRYYHRAREVLPAMQDVAWVYEALAFAIRGNSRESLRLTAKAMSSSRKKTRFLASLVRFLVFMALMKDDEAEEPLQIMEEINPEALEVYMCRALLRQSVGDLEGAITALRWALGRAPTDGEIRGMLLVLLRSREQWEEAEALVSDLIANPPDSPHGVSRAYDALVETGFRSEASSLLRSGREHFPEAIELRHLDAADRLQRGDLSGMLPLFSHIARKLRLTIGL